MENKSHRSSYFYAACQNDGIQAVVNRICDAVATGINDPRFGGLRFTDVGAGGVQVEPVLINGKGFNNFSGSYGITISYGVFGIFGPRHSYTAPGAIKEEDRAIAELIRIWPRSRLYVAVQEHNSMMAEFATGGTD